MIPAAWFTILVLASGALSPGDARGVDVPPGERIVIVSVAHASYRAAADALETALRRAGHDCQRIDLPDDGASQEARERLVAANPGVIAASGPTATAFALEAVPNVPVVYFLVPNVLDAPFMAEPAQRGRLTGVAADIAPEEQVSWIKQSCPVSSKIAVLHSDRTERTAAALVEAGRAKGLKVVPIAADKDNFPNAIERLNAAGCDGVVMIPDAKVYTSATVQRLLLWGVRGKKPVWSFSANTVKAGAFAGMYTEYDQVGRQAADLVIQCAAGQSPEESGLRYPRAITRAVNERIAESIKVRLDERLLASNVVRLGKEE